MLDRVLLGLICPALPSCMLSFLQNLIQYSFEVPSPNPTKIINPILLYSPPSHSPTPKTNPSKQPNLAPEVCQQYNINMITQTLREAQQSPLSKHQYATIDVNTRFKLIRLVEEQDFTIAEAAKMVKVKLSTAKLIVTRFRKTGTVFMRRREALQIQERQNRRHHKKSRKSSNQLQISPQVQSEMTRQESLEPQKPQSHVEVIPSWPVYYFWINVPSIHTSFVLPQ